MADTFIQAAADGAGKKLDTRTEGTNSEHRQVVVLGDPATNAGVAPVDATNGLSVNVTNASLTVGSHAVTNAGTFAVQAAATLAAETTKNIGTVRVSDGTNTATVKTASTAPVAGDSALVVGIHPQSQNANGQATMANSTPVTIASDQTYGNSTGSAVPAKATFTGGNAITALPTAATAGNLTGLSSDKYGRQVTIPITIRDLVGTQTTTLSASTTETTIVTAGGAGVFNDIAMIVVSNTSASTNTRIDFRDVAAGTVLFSLQSNGGQPPVGFGPSICLPQTTANTAWTAQCATSTTDVRIYVVFAKNK